jgi:hypothetical protein
MFSHSWYVNDFPPLANQYTGNVYPNTRLGIPQIKMNDGPQGFRDGSNPGTSTAWPSAMTVVRLLFGINALLFLSNFG